MGGKSSTARRPARRVPVNCPGCGASPLHSAGDARGLNTCRRCGTIFNQNTHTAAPVDSVRRGSAPVSPNRDYQPVASAPEESKDDLNSGASIAGIVRIHVNPVLESLPSAETKIDANAMVETQLKPFFAQSNSYLQIGARFRTASAEWKVTACHPPAGVTTSATIIHCDEPVSTRLPLTKITVLPTVESLNAAGGVEPARWFEFFVKPHFANADHRQISLGEVFLSKGVQFKVVECLPKSGLVHERTEIFCNGQPLSDVAQLRLLPIFESLPNRDKNQTPMERYKKYLEPYFLGCSRIVNAGEDLNIDGVDFKVISCMPARGMVTLQTVISTEGNPLRADDLRAQQMAADEEYARQLQRQEGGPLVMMRPPVPRPASGMVQGGRASSPQELRERLQYLLRQMPPNDPHRPVVQTLHDQLVLMQLMPGAGMGAIVLPHPMSQNHGVHPRDIEALPTREYPGAPPSETGSTADDEKSREHLMCMVCLSEFEKGEVLRTLPCFHSYHRDCIDKWLSTNNKCPMCKTVVGPS